MQLDIQIYMYIHIHMYIYQTHKSEFTAVKGINARHRMIVTNRHSFFVFFFLFKYRTIVIR